MLAAVALRLARGSTARASTSSSSVASVIARYRAYGVLSDPNTFELLQGPEGRLIIDSYDDRGFVINGAYCEGSLFAYEKAHAAWRPRTASAITRASLAALEILDPVPDLLIVGTGRAVQPLSEEVLEYLRELGVAADVSDTSRATSTFNVLVEEGRSVAAVLIPVGS
ncbi:NADH dehydrogenase 1 alpha subcomplex assembly factor 3 [Ostreococcus tauri]|uniref:NADH dehydrogenase [ubiquinone] 1 alpha subcomplex assembly factor 3 n=1 Tax=Ostreococcus tauri TaxID=70448 RepID=A0A1Y5I9J3_OSTTA|nr:NADH dehydrogenase 1 alpha subcomplex assembly factor 3 [Ostreococcus tauri]